jgi:uncharacterized protein
MVDSAVVDVTDVPQRSRYELTVGEQLAGFVEYQLKDNAIALLHTEVVPAFEGQGLASQLIKYTLDDADRRTLYVLPYCPFVRKYLKRHTEQYLHLVPADRRAEFGLPAG